MRTRSESKAPFSKEERKARNRITAKKSRDRKNAYIRELEAQLRIANERSAELERRVQSMELQLLMAHQQEQARPAMDEMLFEPSELVDMFCL